MIATIMHGYLDRLRSYELIADACLPRTRRKWGTHPGTRHRPPRSSRAQKQMSSEAEALFRHRDGRDQPRHE
jgi:hypothetical protein